MKKAYSTIIFALVMVLCLGSSASADIISQLNKAEEALGVDNSQMKTIERIEALEGDLGMVIKEGATLSDRLDLILNELGIKNAERAMESSVEEIETAEAEPSVPNELLAPMLMVKKTLLRPESLRAYYAYKYTREDDEIVVLDTGYENASGTMVETIIIYDVNTTDILNWADALNADLSTQEGIDLRYGGLGFKYESDIERSYKMFGLYQENKDIPGVETIDGWDSCVRWASYITLYSDEEIEELNKQLQ